MPQYLSPGVYVEEVPSAIKPIAGVSTSVAGFVGVVPNKIHLVARNPTFNPITDPPASATKFVDFTQTVDPKTAVLITSWAQFIRTFGDLVGDSGATATTDATPTVDDGHRRLAHAVYGYFNNGGSRCYVSRVAAEADIPAALTAFAAIDEIALVVAPGILSDASRDAVVTHCKATKDRFAIFDGPGPINVTDVSTLARTPTDTPTGGVAPKHTDVAAWYYPWIEVFDPATKLLNPSGTGALPVPPSGHVAGIYARVDDERGVFKAPANEVVRGALNVHHALSKADLDTVSPSGVNCIRAFNGNIFVFGARTIGGDANLDLKYINVRRTLLFLAESIDEGTQWAVFEPNTPELWGKISRNITAFLTTVWRSGALFGTTPQEAFFVKCDAETNPQADRDQGKVTTEIGVAIARPAEFVIFRISQVAPATK